MDGHKRFHRNPERPNTSSRDLGYFLFVEFFPFPIYIYIYIPERSMNHKFKKEEKHTYIHDLFLPKSPWPDQSINLNRLDITVVGSAPQ